MSGVATAIGGAAVIGAYASDQASRRAARAQERGADASIGLQREMFEQQREDLEPWRETGERALSQLETGAIGSNLEMDPSYQFRMKEGLRAMQAAQSAGGRMGGTRSMREMMRYGQDYASQEYGNAYNREYNRLSQLAGFGGSATQQGNQAAQSYGQNVGNIYTGLGNAQGAAAIAQGNNMSNLLGQGMMAYGMYAGR